MKLSDAYNVSFRNHARNKDYTKYRLPPLSQFLGVERLDLKEKDQSDEDNK